MRFEDVAQAHRLNRTARLTTTTRIFMLPLRLCSVFLYSLPADHRRGPPAPRRPAPENGVLAVADALELPRQEILRRERALGGLPGPGLSGSCRRVTRTCSCPFAVAAPMTRL